jgi:hypothetical protein
MKRFLNKISQYLNILDMEADITNCIEQFERSVKLLMPGEDIFDNYDFNLKSNYVSQNKETINESEKEVDADTSSCDDESESESEDDFVEVNAAKSKEEIEKERDEEMKYLGISKNSGFQKLNGKNNAGQLDIDIHLNEDEDNKIVFEIIRGLYKELKNSHLVRVNNWIKVNFLIKF